MDLLEKSDDEIIEIAKPIWDNLVKSSNLKDYGGFTKDFGTQMLFGANEVELGKQWSNKDRKSVVQGKSVDLGGRRIIKKPPPTPNSPERIPTTALNEKIATILTDTSAIGKNTSIDN